MQSAVTISGWNDGGEYFNPCWEVYAEDIYKKKLWLKFQSRFSGTMCWLELRKKGSQIYVWEALEIWPTSYGYSIYLGEEYGAIPYTTTGIARKKYVNL